MTSNNTQDIKVGDWVTKVNWKEDFKVVYISHPYIVLETIKGGTFTTCLAGDFIKVLDPNEKKKTTTPRKHAELIKKWADDEDMVIEASYPSHEEDWVEVDFPIWAEGTEYREKPSEPSEKDLILEDIAQAKKALKAAENRLQEFTKK